MDDSRGSRIDAVRGAPNVGTEMRMGRDEPRLPSHALASAWSSLVPALSLIAPSDARAAYRLFWTGRGENGFRDFALARDAHLIVGRHSACDVVLAGDAELSLRHLLIVPAHVEGGAGLRLVDLQGSMPMHLDDDSAQRSLLAQGPFAVRLGRYVIGGFPIGAGQPSPPHDLPRSERVDASSIDAASQDVSASVSHGHGPYREAAVGRSRTVITALPRPITMVEEIASASAAPDAVGLLGAARDGERARITVGRRALGAGVLVGRADKCDAGLKALLTIRVSRVHAVVIEIDGRVMLYDCASTNGTMVAGRRVRSVELDGDAPVVQLAGSDGVELRWTALHR
ncbi:FHA domain-containing protein [Sandaracinus amylolyticus]|uniref:FHA domain-containing protein n=1 Tax=Sandaracinus amylolyticus TaxID=927083 RepID=UPI001F3A1BE3|nr:FHA domain-containing protein [Sandaracinus amylolyticus]